MTILLTDSSFLSGQIATDVQVKADTSYWNGLKTSTATARFKQTRSLTDHKKEAYDEFVLPDIIGYKTSLC